MELIKKVNELGEDEALDFYENMFNALADKIRLKIINEISKSPNKSLCVCDLEEKLELDRKSTRLNSSHVAISYAVFCLRKKIKRLFRAHKIHRINYERIIDLR